MNKTTWHAHPHRAYNLVLEHTDSYFGKRVRFLPHILCHSKNQITVNIYMRFISKSQGDSNKQKRVFMLSWAQESQQQTIYLKKERERD